MNEIREYANTNVCILLVGNKSDLSAKRVVSAREAQKLAEENHIEYVETSAKSGEKVNDAFHKLTTYVTCQFHSSTMWLQYTGTETCKEEFEWESRSGGVGSS